MIFFKSTDKSGWSIFYLEKFDFILYFNILQKIFF